MANFDILTFNQVSLNVRIICKNTTSALLGELTGLRLFVQIECAATVRYTNFLGHPSIMPQRLLKPTIPNRVEK
jgi:hypothetical protein